MISKLLVFNPNQRLTAEEALEHPYLRDFHDPAEETSYPGTIEIPIDDNKKFSIRDYREALYKEILKRNTKKTYPDDVMNTSVLSTQDSNNNPHKRSAQMQKSKEERNRDRRNYTEYLNRNTGYINNKREENSKQKGSLMRRESSYKKRELSKENNSSAYHTKELRTSQSKEKSNLIRPTQKPLNENKGYTGQKEVKYIDRAAVSSNYFRKR